MYNKLFRCIALCCLLAPLAFADSLGNADSSKVTNPQPQLVAGPQLVYSVPSINGLKITPHSRSLQIVSEENVILYFFDRRIDLVFTKKVPTGFNFISLENQKQGTYYAVLQVGELMQVVRVVVI
jgi:hypothetical protein